MKLIIFFCCFIYNIFKYPLIIFYGLRFFFHYLFFFCIHLKRDNKSSLCSQLFSISQWLMVRVWCSMNSLFYYLYYFICVRQKCCTTCVGVWMYCMTYFCITDSNSLELWWVVTMTVDWSHLIYLFVFLSLIFFLNSNWNIKLLAAWIHLYSCSCDDIHEHHAWLFFFGFLSQIFISRFFILFFDWLLVRSHFCVCTCFVALFFRK